MYDGLKIVEKFLTKFESMVPEHQRFDALKWALRATPAHWWGTHEGTFEDWHDYKQMMHIRFGKLKLQITKKYDGCNDPCMHLTKWTKAYGEEPYPKWVHLFYHTLDVIPRNQYTETKLRHGTGEWDILREGFLLTFLFEYQWMDIVDDALQVVKVSIFKIPLEPKEIGQPEWSYQLSQALECYNVQVDDDEDDPRNINTPEIEGSRAVRGPMIEDPDIIVPLKMKQVNIVTQEEPKYATLRDYWDDVTVNKVVE